MGNLVTRPKVGTGLIVALIGSVGVVAFSAHEFREFIWISRVLLNSDKLALSGQSLFHHRTMNEAFRMLSASTVAVAEDFVADILERSPESCGSVASARPAITHGTMYPNDASPSPSQHVSSRKNSPSFCRQQPTSESEAFTTDLHDVALAQRGCEGV